MRVIAWKHLTSTNSGFRVCARSKNWSIISARDSVFEFCRNNATIFGRRPRRNFTSRLKLKHKRRSVLVEECLPISARSEKTRRRKKVIQFFKVTFLLSFTFLLLRNIIFDDVNNFIGCCKHLVFIRQVHNMFFFFFYCLRRHILYYLKGKNLWGVEKH